MNQARADAVGDQVGDLVTIDAFSDEGRGVAKVTGRDGNPGKTIFIAGALPGETVRYRRTRKRRKFDEGVTTEVLNPSGDRVEPECDFFNVCGGCTLQHLSGAKQIEFKQGVLSDQLQRIGRVVPESWLPPLSSKQFGYRRRARLGVKRVDKKGRVLVGFRERSKPYITNMTHCLTLAPPVGSMLEALSELIWDLSISRRLPQIEVAVADNAVALVFRVLDSPSENDLTLFRSFSKSHGVQIFLQSKGLDSVLPLDPGREPLIYRIDAFDVTLEFEPTDFLQVNGDINQRMVQLAIELLQLKSGDTVLDLFCGLGNFSLPLARSAKQVTGVEGDLALVQRACKNSQRNGINNTEFYLGNLFEPDEDTPWMQRKYSAILLDPPRAGAFEIAKNIDRFEASRVVYISCNPATLARDAAELSNHGYTLQSAGVMDMFPHTSHIESIALFQR